MERRGDWLMPAKGVLPRDRQPGREASWCGSLLLLTRSVVSNQHGSQFGTGRQLPMLPREAGEVGNICGLVASPSGLRSRRPGPAVMARSRIAGVCGWLAVGHHCLSERNRGHARNVIRPHGRERGKVTPSWEPHAAVP
jgi:hypothetical protein